MITLNFNLGLVKMSIG